MKKILVAVLFFVFVFGMIQVVSADEIYISAENLLGTEEIAIPVFMDEFAEHGVFFSPASSDGINMVYLMFGLSGVMLILFVVVSVILRKRR